MLGVYFEGFIMNIHGYYNVPSSDFKYIHYNLTYAHGFKIVTLMVGSNFVTTFFPRLNVGSFIHIYNFGITFKNKFEHGD
jgi:hypothetical protein